MEHRYDCACCREHAMISQETKGAALFSGAWFFDLPAASAAAANGEGELMVYACRRGSLRFLAGSGQTQSLHAGELAVWKAGRFLSGDWEAEITAFTDETDSLEIGLLAEQLLFHFH